MWSTATLTLLIDSRSTNLSLGVYSPGIPPRPRRFVRRFLPRLPDRQRPESHVVHPWTGQGARLDGGVIVQVAAIGEVEGVDVVGEPVRLRPC
jgi:hypothetical protein